MFWDRPTLRLLREWNYSFNNSQATESNKKQRKIIFDYGSRLVCQYLKTRNYISGASSTPTRSPLPVIPKAYTIHIKNQSFLQCHSIIVQGFFRCSHLQPCFYMLLKRIVLVLISNIIFRVDSSKVQNFRDNGCMKYFRWQVAITVRHTDNGKWGSIPFVI